MHKKTIVILGFLTIFVVSIVSWAAVRIDTLALRDAVEVSHIAFADKSKASEFESYLKSGSGRAFANKRLW